MALSYSKPAVIMGIKSVKLLLTSIVLAILVVACNLATTDAESVTPVDTILTNGKIYTLSEERPIVDALAISDGVILAVGDAKTIAALAIEGTTTIDLDGQVVMPGLYDLHVHPVFAGIQASRCVIPQGANLPEVQGHTIGGRDQHVAAKRVLLRICAAMYQGARSLSTGTRFFHCVQVLADNPPASPG